MGRVGVGWDGSGWGGMGQGGVGWVRVGWVGVGWDAGGGGDAVRVQSKSIACVKMSNSSMYLF